MWNVFRGTPGRPKGGCPRLLECPKATSHPAFYKMTGSRPTRQFALPALMDMRTSKAQAGYVFFPWKGNIKKVKRLDLLYSGPGGDIVIRVRGVPDLSP